MRPAEATASRVKVRSSALDNDDSGADDDDNGADDENDDIAAEVRLVVLSAGSRVTLTEGFLILLMLVMMGS